MSSTILDFIKLNEKIDYSFLIPLVILYFVGFWVLVSVWVYIDSKKRILRKRNRILILICNLIFGLPFFLLYLLARPYDREEEEAINDAINVPLVNFTNQDGILMSLELKISPALISGERSGSFDAKMKVEVETSNKMSNEVLKKENPETIEIIETPNTKNGILNLFKGLIKSKKKNIKEEIKQDMPVDSKSLIKSSKKKNKKKKH